MIRLAFFDSKEYDIRSFNSHIDSSKYLIKYFDVRLNEDTAKLANGYDAVIAFVNDTLSNAVIDELADYGIKVIFLRCAGFNNVNLTECFKKNIHVYRVPAYSPYAVAEHAMALLLTINRRIHKAYNRTREYNFSLENLSGFDLYEKTVGVIGTGKIGRVFIDICRGFHMNVLAYDPYPIPNSDYNYVSLDEIFEKSDVISLHCPLTDETKHIINAESLSKMKIGAVIVNTSRGGLIDSKALLESIKTRHIGAACLDVYEEESDIFYSDRSNHILDDETLRSLISMPNVIVTSHQAFLTIEALSNIASTTMSNVENFFFGDPDVNNEVCYQCGNQQNCKKKRNQKCF